jgi:preprotein translocase subunit SecA
MINLTQFFNNKNIKKYNTLISRIHVIEEKTYGNLPIEKIAESLLEVKNNNSMKEKDKILHAIALAKKASSHVLNMTYYDVQLMGALALVDGCIAEMKTGEGKTLTCSAAVAANYVLGFKTHVATANEYLAQRDQQTLEPLYSFLGISSSFSISPMEKPQKREAYKCEVLYSTAQELGFDFLRDNLVQSLDEKIQPLDFSKVKSIIDEADFILIDEARTPLIISGEAPIKNEGIYHLIKDISLQLKRMPKAPSEIFDEEIYNNPNGDFWVDEKYKTVYLSEQGYESLEKIALEKGILTINQEQVASHPNMLALYQNHNSWIIHEVLNALKASLCYIKDKDYIVQNNEIVIIDQNTGRLSEGRSWSNGLHQAIETKENTKITVETLSLGSISIQNYFRNYAKISGMSGTVMGSTEEFQDIYNTTTIQIPTNRKMIRINHEDKIYLSMKAKYLGIIEDIVARNKKGQPILIGTTSVAESEIISELMNKHNIKHHVLNAKNNFREAQIIAQAGQPYSVTVSTSMAGRGTDIILGGNKTELLNILTEQLNSVYERLGFFETISTQINIPQPELAEDMTEEEIINMPYDHIDHNDLQEQINYLYNPEHVSSILQQGTVFIRRHLKIIEQSIKKQIEVVTNEHTNWRTHVLNVGGLHVLGSSRNESRRIDDQLRGRSGRQGDPGESTFYLSIEDPWVNIFGRNPLFAHLAKTLPPNEAISSPIVSKGFLKAQNSIEAHHFNARKDTFQYDSIADEGRRQFLNLRDLLLVSTETTEKLLKSAIYDMMLPLAHPDFLDFMEEKINLGLDDQQQLIKTISSLPIQEIELHTNKFLSEREYNDMKEIKQQYLSTIEEKINEIVGSKDEDFYKILNSMTLKQLDKRWAEHLVFVEDARQNVAFSSLAQKNPLHEFKKMCFESFSSMFGEFKHQIMEDFSKLSLPIQNEETETVTFQLQETEHIEP